MGVQRRPEIARGLAKGALVIVCIWAFFGVVVGVELVASVGHHHWSLAPFGIDSDPFAPNGWGFFLTFAPLSIWFATLNGVVVAAVMGSIAIRHTHASWGRILAFVCALVAGVAFAMWWGLRDLVGNDNPPGDNAKLTSGVGVILIVIAVVALLRWLLKPAFAGLAALPPPDPSTRLYSDSTT